VLVLLLVVRGIVLVIVPLVQEQRQFRELFNMASEPASSSDGLQTGKKQHILCCQKDMMIDDPSG
jgi:hypothetical protein